MKTYIQFDGTTYHLFDNGVEKKIRLCPNAKGGAELALSENSCNVKFLKIKKFEANAKDGVYELQLNTREPRKLGEGGTKTSTTRTFAWPEYLTDEERKQYEHLKEVAIARATDPAEQIRRQIAALQAKLEGLNKTEAAE